MSNGVAQRTFRCVRRFNAIIGRSHPKFLPGQSCTPASRQLSSIPSGSFFPPNCEAFTRLCIAKNASADMSVCGNASSSVRIPFNR